LRSPATGPLAERWKWAEQNARALGTSYWVGYVVAGDPSGKSKYYSDDIPVYISNGSVTLSGRMQFMDADVSGITFAGVPLRTVTRDHSPNSTAILFLLGDGLRGKRIERLHVGTFSIPTWFDRKPLIWLDSASDSESIALIKSITSRARSEDVRADLVAAAGVHQGPEAMAHLTGLLESTSEPDKIREEAAEWLGKRGTGVAIAPLSRAVRTDRSNRVREQAIEAFSHVDAASATDSLISFASSLAMFDQRKTAIEALGHRTDSRALNYLIRVASAEMDSNLPEHAIEALGGMPDGIGFPGLIELARTSRSVAARRAAAEAIGASKPESRALEVLSGMARSDPDEDVRAAAIEAIASVHDERSVSILRDFAGSQSPLRIQLAAVEALGSTVKDDAAMGVLRTIIASHPSYEVRGEAMETIGDMRGGDAFLATIAQGRDNDDVRKRALEAYSESVKPATAAAFLKSIAAKDRSPDVRARAAKLLEDLEQ
jgi:HEAT repeat protein